MKKMLVALIAVGVLSLVATSPLVAQTTNDAAIVKVPFQFIAGDRVLPAGSYRIAPQTSDWAVISISSLDGQNAGAAVVATQGEPSASAATGADVKFMSYHGQYFLQEVVLPGRDARRILVTPSTAERTLAKLNLSNAAPATPAK